MDFDGAALIQFNNESTDEDGMCDTGAVQVKWCKQKPKVKEEPAAAPKDIVSVIHEGIAVHKEMMLASKEVADARSGTLVVVLEQFLVSEWDSWMVMQAMLWDLTFKDSRSRSGSPPSKRARKKYED